MREKLIGEAQATYYTHDFVPATIYRASCRAPSNCDAEVKLRNHLLFQRIAVSQPLYTHRSLLPADQALDSGGPSFSGSSRRRSERISCCNLALRSPACCHLQLSQPGLVSLVCLLVLDGPVVRCGLGHANGGLEHVFLADGGGRDVDVRVAE